MDQSSPKLFRGCYTTKPLANHAKFCGDQLKNAGDIHNRKFVLQKKWAKVHQNLLGDATPKPSHHAKFHQDRSNQLGEKC